MRLIGCEPLPPYFPIETHTTSSLRGFDSSSPRIEKFLRSCRHQHDDGPVTELLCAVSPPDPTEFVLIQN